MPTKETISLKKKNDALKNELLASKRELKTEASLERVRKVALKMKKRDDMLEICRVIAKQLAILGIKEIRNVQTAIFYVERGTYMNYEYYAKHDKLIVTETNYTNHRIHKAFAKKMMDGKKLTEIKLPFGYRMIEKKALEKVEGTIIEEMLKRYNLI